MRVRCIKKPELRLGRLKKLYRQIPFRTEARNRARLYEESVYGRLVILHDQCQDEIWVRRLRDRVFRVK